ncbi:ATP-dependent Clp protease ATP-binding subunit [Candidatus Uhrbacteria bacterium]|nr:ATP-dependent Clp protease ATP-binding subunit [Candidatus Uhrbacteria bacterium]
MSAELAGTLLFWGKRIDSFELTLDRVRALTKTAISVVCILVAALLLGYFFWHVGFVEGVDVVFTTAFWGTPSLALLALWLALLDVLYLVTRAIRAAELMRPVQRRTYLREGGLPSMTPVSPVEAKRFSRKNRIDIARTYAPASLQAIASGFARASAAKHAELLPTHLIAALVSTKPLLILFGRLGIHRSKIEEPLERLLGTQSLRHEGATTALGTAFFETVFDAYYYAYEHRRPRVSPVSLFVAAAAHDSAFQEILFGLGVDQEKLRNVVAWLRISDELRERYQKFRSAARLRPKGAMNRTMTALATPALDRVSHDLTAVARSGYLPPLVNRDRELTEIFRVFEGGAKSVIMVGQHGVGKDAVVEGIAARMIEEEVPAALRDKRMVVLSIPEITSGVTPAQAQARLLTVLGEVARSGNIILVVPNIEGMVGVSVGEGIDLSDAFAAEISKGYFLCIATTTPDAYTRLVEARALGRTLERIRVDELESNTAIQVLESKSGSIEYDQKVFFSYDALEKAVILTARYVHERFLPEKAIEVAREAAQMVRSKRGERQIVTGEDVAAIVSDKTRIPVTEVTAGEAEKLLKLEERLHERVVGQDEAVKAVAAALRRARAELRSEKRPIANFLFLGPTGVGKTELAKTVAAVYFGREESMVRLDMSEYQDQASIYRLIGPPGETGGGVLTEAVRKQPFTLLLLDELEKAHKDVLNVFLQVMDDGRLTDNGGRVIDFTNVIIIATSNAGSQVIQDEVRTGATVEAVKSKLMNEVLRQYFRPEFLNRFDGVIVFTPLTPDEILQITWLMIAPIKEKMKAKGIEFEVHDAAAEELSQAGFDPVFGARPLRRVIQERIENALANFLLTQKLGRRDTVILKAGGILEVQKAPEL